MLLASDLAGGPPLRSLPGDGETFAVLRQALVAADYTVTTLARVFGLQNPSEVSATRRHLVPVYSWRCEQADTPAAWLARLWMFSETIPTEQAERSMGATAVALLLRRGILKRVDQGLKASVDMYPCEGAWIFTDHAMPSRLPSMRHVYELGADSYALARLTPRRQVQSTLDLCTGSGVQAILAARHSRHSVGVDVNPRALQFAGANAGINDFGDRCRFVAGDLYAAVGGDTFDLIVSNPPWVPTPEVGMQLHRTGGESGESITRRIVEGLSSHLRPGGTLAMYVNYPEIRGSSYIERLTTWLGGTTGWGVALVNCLYSTLESYIGVHQAPNRTAAEADQHTRRWLDSYQRMGIERIRMGMVYIRRLVNPDSGWQVTRDIRLLPGHDMAPHLDPWLDTLERYHDASWTVDWDGWQPRPKSGSTVWRSSDGRARLESATDGWDPPIDLNTLQLHFLDMLTDGRSAADVASAWSVYRSVDASTARAETETLLRAMGQANILQ